MTLGEKISKLRNEHNMSQGDLAEKMNVSRQSISKWETGASIPDLDKLIALSSLFQVSIDELAKDNVCNNELTKDTSISQEKELPSQRPYSTQKIIGFILIAAGIICGILAVMFARRVLLIPISYLLVCGCLCLLIKRYVVLVIGWITILPAAVLLPYFISSDLRAIFKLYYYQNGLYMQLIVSFLMWILLLSLVWGTIRAFQKRND